MGATGTIGTSLIKALPGETTTSPSYQLVGASLYSTLATRIGMLPRYGRTLHAINMGAAGGVGCGLGSRGLL